MPSRKDKLAEIIVRRGIAAAERLAPFHVLNVDYTKRTFGIREVGIRDRHVFKMPGEFPGINELLWTLRLSGFRLTRQPKSPTRLEGWFGPTLGIIIVLVDAHLPFAEKILDRQPDLGFPDSTA